MIRPRAQVRAPCWPARQLAHGAPRPPCHPVAVPAPNNMRASTSGRHPAASCDAWCAPAPPKPQRNTRSPPAPVGGRRKLRLAFDRPLGCPIRSFPPARVLAHTPPHPMSAAVPFPYRCQRHPPHPCISSVPPFHRLSRIARYPAPPLQYSISCSTAPPRTPLSCLLIPSQKPFPPKPFPPQFLQRSKNAITRPYAPSRLPNCLLVALPARLPASYLAARARAGSALATTCIPLLNHAA